MKQPSENPYEPPLETSTHPRPPDKKALPLLVELIRLAVVLSAALLIAITLISLWMASPWYDVN